MLQLSPKCFHMKYPQIRKYIHTDAEKQIPVCHVSEKQNFWLYSASIAISSPENTRFSFTFMLFNNTRRAFLAEKHLQLTPFLSEKTNHRQVFHKTQRTILQTPYEDEKLKSHNPPILYTYYTPKNPTTLYSKPG